jgi:nucleoside-diphosphate-sugar epimerase
MNKPILLTGATGFVGGAILRHILHAGMPVRVASRRAPAVQSPLIEQVSLGNLETLTREEATQLVRGTHAIIHSAGYAHATGQADEARHMAINRDASIRLAEAAKREGVDAFVFLSSIRAQSGASAPYPLRDDDMPLPTDAYGHAKLAAEKAIRLLLPHNHIILRPVLVCGAGAGGNLAQLLRLARLPVPLPLAGLKGRRSLIALDDLAALALRSLHEPEMRGRTMQVADPDALSLAEIVSTLREGMGRPLQLFSVPEEVMRLGIRLLKGEEFAQRLTGSLVAQADSLTELGWKPSYGVRNALRAFSGEMQTGSR